MAWDGLILPGVQRFPYSNVLQTLLILWLQQLAINYTPVFVPLRYVRLEGCDPKGTGVAIELAPLLCTTTQGTAKFFVKLVNFCEEPPSSHMNSSFQNATGDVVKVVL